MKGGHFYVKFTLALVSCWTALDSFAFPSHKSKGLPLAPRQPASDTGSQ